MKFLIDLILRNKKELSTGIISGIISGLIVSSLIFFLNIGIEQVASLSNELTKNFLSSLNISVKTSEQYYIKGFFDKDYKSHYRISIQNIKDFSPSKLELTFISKTIETDIEEFSSSKIIQSESFWDKNRKLGESINKIIEAPSLNQTNIYYFTIRHEKRFPNTSDFTIKVKHKDSEYFLW